MDCQVRAFEFPAPNGAVPLTAIPPRAPRAMQPQVLQSVRPHRIAALAIMALFTASRPILAAMAHVLKARGA